MALQRPCLRAREKLPITAGVPARHRRGSATDNACTMQRWTLLATALGGQALADAPAGVPTVSLTRLIARRSALIIVIVVVLTLVLAWVRTERDVGDELSGAMVLAQLAATLSTAHAHSDDDVLAQLRALEAAQRLRHLRLVVQDAQGRTVYASGAAGLAAVDARPPAVQWDLPRPSAPAWRVTLQPAPDSERAEALASTIEALVMMLLLAAGALAAMAWSVRRALAPLDAMRHAIVRAESHDRDALRHLPPMPVTELEAVAATLRHLAQALDAAQQRQRLLTQQLLGVQEEERQRIARELHDELGQRLTALRADVAWLTRRLAERGGCFGDEVRTVLAGIAEHGECLQREVRDLLSRLNPLGGDGAAPTLRRLGERIEALAAGWHGARRGLRVTVRIGHGDAAADVALPGPLALTVYRITQEALTNVARHAQATCAHVELQLDGDAQRPQALHWRVEDDGVGIDDLDAAWRRGSGLAGLHERVWALGARLECEPLHPAGQGRPGVRLSARFALDAWPGARVAGGA
jgi:two-component system sensor histidine kinase UhpB